MFKQMKHTFNQGINTASYQLGFSSPVQYAIATLQENSHFYLDQAKDFCAEKAENAVELIGESVHSMADTIFDFFNQ